MSGTGAWRFASAPGRKKTRAVLPYGPLKETSAFVRAERQPLVSFGALDRASESCWLRRK